MAMRHRPPTKPGKATIFFECSITGRVISPATPKRQTKKMVIEGTVGAEQRTKMHRPNLHEVIP
jgi:hypothetical protein